MGAEMNVGTLGTIFVTAAQSERALRKWPITGTGTNPEVGEVLPVVIVRSNGSTLNVRVFLDVNADVWFPGNSAVWPWQEWRNPARPGGGHGSAVPSGLPRRTDGRELGREARRQALRGQPGGSHGVGELPDAAVESRLRVGGRGRLAPLGHLGRRAASGPGGLHPSTSAQSRPSPPYRPSGRARWGPAKWLIPIQGVAAV